MVNLKEFITMMNLLSGFEFLKAGRKDQDFSTCYKIQRWKTGQEWNHLAVVNESLG